MKQNYHIHTRWSADARMELKDALEACRTRGFTHIAITDHVDFHTPYADDVVSDIAACHAEIDNLRCQFPELEVSKGVEVGLHGENLEATSDLLAPLQPDFVIASVHSFRCGLGWNRESAEAMGMGPYIHRYLEEVLLITKTFHTWSVLGHLDFPMRYHPISEEDLMGAKDLVDSILHEVIARKRGLEINLAGVGKIGRAHPATWILKRYLELGGTILTLGTDAHDIDELERGWQEGRALLRELGSPPLWAFRNMLPYRP